MTVEVRVSTTYVLLIEDSTFVSGSPCIAVRMMFIGDGAPQQRAIMRFGRETLGRVIEGLEKARTGM